METVEVLLDWVQAVLLKAPWLHAGYVQIDGTPVQFDHTLLEQRRLFGNQPFLRKASTSKN